MKYLLIFTLFCPALFAQTILEPVSLEICAHKTTHLVFSSPIVSVDRGSSQVLVQQMKGAAHILQLKATRPGFNATNLTVLTSDGFLRSFELSYAEQPRLLTYAIGLNTEKTQPDQLQALTIKAEQLAGGSQKSPKRLKRLHLQGVYQGGPYYLVSLVVKNDSKKTWLLQKARLARTQQEALNFTSQRLSPGQQATLVLVFKGRSFSRSERLELLGAPKKMSLRLASKLFSQALPLD